MPTALQYLHALAEETSEFDRAVTTSAGATDSLVCARYAGANLPATRFAGMHALIESGPCSGQVGHVQGGGLTRSTGAIAFTNDLTAAIGAGVAFSFYRLLAPLRYDAEPSYLDIVNQSLLRLRVERTIEFIGVNEQAYYAVDTDAYPWFTDPDRILWVEYPTTQLQEIPRRLDANGWDWDADGETKRLFFRGAPFRSGETFRVKVMAPGNSRLRKDATAYAVLTADAVTAIQVVTGGYYLSPPTVTLTGGGGTGATATAVLTGTAVTSIVVGAGGSGYTSPPTVTLSAGDWADQADQRAGLEALTDEAVADVADVVTMGKARMFDALSNLMAPSSVVAEWLTKAKPNIAAARNLQQLGVGEDRAVGVARLRPVRAYQRGRS